MWALIVDGSINRIFKYPTAFKHPTTGIQYPRNWLNLATDSEKASVGFIEVTYSGSHKDGEYYINSESSPVYNASAGTVVITRSTSAKNLANVKAEKLENLVGDNAKFNADKMIDIFKGKDNDFSKAVCLNAAAGLIVNESNQNFADSYKDAREHILSSKVINHLEKVRND